MTEVDDIVLRRFSALYGAPDTTDAKMFLEEYRQALGGADRDVLNEAVGRAVAEHEFSSKVWPSIGTLRRLVDVVAMERFNRNRQRYVPDDNHQQATPEQRARVAALVATMVKNMAEKHKKRGNKPVLYALYEEIHGEPWPSQRAIEAMKAKGAR